MLAGTMFAQAQPPRRQVAITFDDLPVAQSGDSACDEPGLTKLTQQLLNPFREGLIPVTAFVIAGRCSRLTEAQRTAVLKLWIAARAEIGNHTFSHRGLNTMSIEDYHNDILKADAELRRTLGIEQLRYFRSPMLQTGPTKEAKQQLEDFLKTQGYRQSPVTIDNSDWIYATVYSNALAGGDIELAQKVQKDYIEYMETVIGFFERRSVEVAGREFPQILLLHANKLNSDSIPSLLAMMRRRGYEFISLETALDDPVYKLPNEYAGKGGFSWIHRWSMTKGMANKEEADPPRVDHARI